MDELSIIFSSRPATGVFYVASIIFILAYLAGFLFVLGWSRAPGRRAVIRHGIPALAATEFCSCVHRRHSITHATRQNMEVRGLPEGDALGRLKSSCTAPGLTSGDRQAGRCDGARAVEEGAAR
jgi:hypothetical protein